MLDIDTFRVFTYYKWEYTWRYVLSCFAWHGLALLLSRSNIKMLEHCTERSKIYATEIMNAYEWYEPASLVHVIWLYTTIPKWMAFIFVRISTEKSFGFIRNIVIKAFWYFSSSDNGRKNLISDSMINFQLKN